MSLSASESALVTVTGASGFIAVHCVRELLSRGYRVRGTLRDRSDEAKVREALRSVDAGDRLSFVEAELLDDRGWQAAVEGAELVLHVASPVPNAKPKSDDELIRPAREGALRVLRAAREAGVKRVVMTSSMAAVSSGRPRGEHVFDENDWSDLDRPTGAYEKSKTLAERAAWDFVRESGGPELVALNPVFVLGPSLLGVHNTSNEIVRKLIRREIPGVPRWQLGVVDVRDVATAHVLAMTAEQAAGERFILVSDIVWMKQIAEVLASAGYKVPRFEVPSFVVHLIALFDPAARLILDQLGQPFQASNEKAKKLLGWSGRGMKEMVLDTAASIESVGKA